jgi:hypothetical protein
MPESSLDKCYQTLSLSGQPIIMHINPSRDPGRGVPMWMCECGRRPLTKHMPESVEYLGDLAPMVKNETVVRGFINPAYKPEPISQSLPAWKLDEDLEKWNQ